MTNAITKPSPVSRITGPLLLFTVSLSLISALTGAIDRYMVGIPIWVAVLLMLPSQKKNQLIQSGLLVFVGFLGLAVSAVKGSGGGYVLKALEANQLLVAMVIGVSFLRIIATQNTAKGELLPVGSGAMITTLFGGHLISAVINMSSLMIMGDRLAAKRALTPIQAITLLRAFSTAALWSPFFAAMGVILISAPGATLSTLVLFGIPSTLVALFITAWQLTKHTSIDTSPGYPMHFGALWLPLTLAVLVMVEHNLWPEISVITLVTLTAVLFVPAYLLITRKPNSKQLLAQHIYQGLPKLSGEITLFLSAAVMAAGVSAMVASFNVHVAPQQFNIPAAWVTLVAVVVLAIIGMHPIATTILAGSLLMPTVTDPNLLGITLLLAWAIGVGVSPVSGVQLTIQSRYEVSPWELIKLNRVYTPAMLCVGFVVVWLYGHLNGIGF